eukprot:TRINITY_DN842_c0_g1_i2.p1 TRINITY_DN842_c0_g1~~TRINITY_DN842_c0_g1_i2.p1  ORF type:complete len:110 (+),score=20.85 TRINITY_DN842_c0_g1_i2:72-401(+)
MSVRVLSERLIKRGMEDRVVGLMQQMRSAAIFSRGFISAEAVREVSQPQRYVIWSSWHHIDDWCDTLSDVIARLFSSLQSQFPMTPFATLSFVVCISANRVFERTFRYL